MTREHERLGCADDLCELYCEFGRAAEMAQVMEMEAGNLALVYATMLVDTSKITAEQRDFFRALLRDVNKRTFGDLFRHIQKFSQLDDSAIKMVNRALEKRNYLTHRFFRKHNFAIESVEGRKVMLVEIREIREALSLGHAVLSSMTISLERLLAKVFGRTALSEEEVLALMAKGERLDL